MFSLLIIPLESQMRQFCATLIASLTYPHIHLTTNLLTYPSIPSSTHPPFFSKYIPILAHPPTHLLLFLTKPTSARVFSHNWHLKQSGCQLVPTALITLPIMNSSAGWLGGLMVTCFNFLNYKTVNLKKCNWAV